MHVVCCEVYIFKVRFLLRLCSSFPSVCIMSSDRGKVKFVWLRRAFSSPRKLQKNYLGQARPTLWGSPGSDESCEDCCSSLNVSSGSVELGELEGIQLSTPKGRQASTLIKEDTPKTGSISIEPRGLFGKLNMTAEVSTSFSPYHVKLIW